MQNYRWNPEYFSYSVKSRTTHTHSKAIADAVRIRRPELIINTEILHRILCLLRMLLFRRSQSAEMPATKSTLRIGKFGMQLPIPANATTEMQHPAHPHRPHHADSPLALQIPYRRVEGWHPAHQRLQQAAVKVYRSLFLQRVQVQR